MKNRLRKDDVGFVQVSNEILNDKTLSLKAKGLYSFMFSKPNNWNFTIKSMSSQLKEGVNSISEALKELKNANWVYYQKYKDGTGEYYLYAKPQNPNNDFPNLENEGVLVTSINNNTYNKKEKYSSTIENNCACVSSFFNIKLNNFQIEAIKINSKYNVNALCDTFNSYMIEEYGSNLKNNTEGVREVEEAIRLNSGIVGLMFMYENDFDKFEGILKNIY